MLCWENKHGKVLLDKCNGETKGAYIGDINVVVGKLSVGMVVCWNLMVLINDGTPCSNPADCS